ncbi:MAG: TonB-dependent receptor [Cyclobacteriaceae bacterium]|nr:TonB-dependent receptor [Cyclobacteriaceae bacterium]
MKARFVFFNIRSIISITLLLMISPGMWAQNPALLSGKLVEEDGKTPVSFANVVLYQLPDSVLLHGITSDVDGKFQLTIPKSGSVFVKISNVGFEPVFIMPDSIMSFELGIIPMQEAGILLSTLFVEGERIKGITEGEKAVYFVNRKSIEASNTGMDIINLIPGAYVDFQQNISINGRSRVLIFVNGAERDSRYIQQLRADQIDRVEIINNPSSRFMAEADAVINIILAERERGFSGMAYIEAPISRNEVYSHPTASLAYNTRNLHLYSAYNGAFSFFDVVQSYDRRVENLGNIHSEQITRQRSKSQTFHQGLEYAISPSTLLHAYVAAGSFSEEHNGNISVTKNESAPWVAMRDENDKNRSLTSALFLQHQFGEKEENRLTLDFTHSRLRGENILRFTNAEDDESFVNHIQPSQRIYNLRTDYQKKAGTSSMINTGFQFQSTQLENGHQDDFGFANMVSAAYTSISWQKSAFDMEAGLRAEYFNIEIANQDQKTSSTNLLPNVRMGYRWNEKHAARIFLRSSMIYPMFHQLNNFEAFADPFTMTRGNQGLQPYRFNSSNLEHIWSNGNLMLITAAFVEQRTNIINTLHTVSETGIMEVSFANLGDVYQYGLQSTGALNLGKRISLNHSVRLFNTFSKGHDTNLFPSRNKFAIETGFSGVMAFEHDFFLTLRFRYLSPVNDVQSDFFSGPLYFIAAEKQLSGGIKLGLTSGLPMARNFTYFGLDTRGENFHQRSTGKIQMSAIPLWFTMSYSLQKGKTKNKGSKTVDSGLHFNKRGF